MRKINEFDNGFTAGMLVTINDMTRLIHRFEAGGLTKYEMVEILKDSINLNIESHITDNKRNLSEYTYNGLVVANDIIVESIKECLHKNIFSEKG